MRRHLQTAMIAAALMTVQAASACGGDGDVTLLVDEIDDAVGAVSALTGRPPNFFEINATPQLINLFLDDGKGSAINFVWENGSLRDETEAAKADGRAFDASKMVFSPGVYARVEAELPDSLLRAFTLTADGPNDEVQHRVVLQSERGGQFAVLVDSLGKILGSDPLAGP